MNKCFIYCRKSSEDAKKQVQSIESQKIVMSEVAQNNGLVIADIITDEKSARKPNKRTGFFNMISRIKKDEANIIVVWKTDRLSRNPLESGQISQLLQDGVIQKIITIEKVFTPEESQILFALENAMASEYSRNLSMNVKRGHQRKIDLGIYPSNPPTGYISSGPYKGAKKIVPDPATFPILKKLWDILKNEKPQLADLYRIMKDKYPLYYKGRAKVISFSSFHRIFNNKFYCGIFTWNEAEHLGAHKKMLTQSEFAMVQEHLHKKEKTRERSLDFDFKGLFNCGTCNAYITAERKKKFIKKTGEHKHFEYYKCAHHKRDFNCKEKPLSKTKIENNILKELSKIYLPPEIIECGKQDIKRRLQKDRVILSVVSRNIRQSLGQQKQKITQLEDNICLETDQSTRDLMKKRLQSAKINLQKLEEDYDKEHSAPKEFLESIKNQLEIIHKISKKFKTGDKSIRQHIIKNIGSDWKIKEKSLVYKPYLLPRAIKKIRNSLSPNFPKFGLILGNNTAKKLTSDEANLVWRKGRDSNP